MDGGAPERPGQEPVESLQTVGGHPNAAEPGVQGGDVGCTDPRGELLEERVGQVLTYAGEIHGVLRRPSISVARCVIGEHHRDRDLIGEARRVATEIDDQLGTFLDHLGTRRGGGGAHGATVVHGDLPVP